MRGCLQSLVGDWPLSLTPRTASDSKRQNRRPLPWLGVSPRAYGPQERDLVPISFGPLDKVGDFPLPIESESQTESAVCLPVHMFCRFPKLRPSSSGI